MVWSKNPFILLYAIFLTQPTALPLTIVFSLKKLSFLPVLTAQFIWKCYCLFSQSLVHITGKLHQYNTLLQAHIEITFIRLERWILSPRYIIQQRPTCLWLTVPNATNSMTLLTGNLHSKDSPTCLIPVLYRIYTISNRYQQTL